MSFISGVGWGLYRVEGRVGLTFSFCFVVKLSRGEYLFLFRGWVFFFNLFLGISWIFSSSDISILRFSIEIMYLIRNVEFGKEALGLE